MHGSCVPRLRLPRSSPTHDTLPIIARMPLSIAQEIFRPVEILKHVHCRWAEVGSALQALPDMVHAVVDVLSPSCLPCALSRPRKKVIMMRFSSPTAASHDPFPASTLMPINHGRRRALRVSSRPRQLTLKTLATPKCSTKAVLAAQYDMVLTILTTIDVDFLLSTSYFYIFLVGFRFGKSKPAAHECFVRCKPMFCNLLSIQAMLCCAVYSVRSQAGASLW